MDKYVYMLLEDDTPFYVGKGTLEPRYSNVYQRPTNHIAEASLPKEQQSNRLKCAHINKILKNGKQVIVKIIKEKLSDEQALELENELIQKYKRIHEGGTLTNLVAINVSHDVRRTPVYCFLPQGTFVKKFHSVKEAAQETGASAGAIVNCCRGRYKSSKGYVWSYANTFPGYSPRTAWNKRKVDCYDLSGTFIHRYESAMEAESLTGVPAGDINKCRRGESYTAGGFVWVEHGASFKTPTPQSAGKRKRPVQQYRKDGKLIREYASVQEAITSTGFTGITRCCRKYSKTCGGYVWKYKETAQCL